MIHRLDKDTSGIILLARDVITANKFSILFKQKMVKKIYWALVEGVPQKKEGKLESYIGKTDIWKPNIKVDQNIKYDQAVDDIKEILINSVKHKMRSDVEVAFCLSGGVDSNSLIGIASKVLNI